MKCDRCKTESNFDGGFFQERKSFRSSLRTLCTACWNRRRRAREKRALLWMFLPGVFGVVLRWAAPELTMGQFFINLFFINIFVILCVLPHELGHAMTARLFGLKVYRIVLGVGKSLRHFHAFGFLFEIRQYPIAGITVAAPISADWMRLKHFVFILAGPMVNAVLLVLPLYFWPGNEGGVFSELPWLVQMFILANGLILFTNLYPRPNIGGLSLSSDGMQLLTALSPGKKAAAAFMVMRHALEFQRCKENHDVDGALEWCSKGLALFPEDPTLLSLQGIGLMDRQEYAQARELFLRMLAKEKQPGMKRFVILNNIAYANALMEDPALLPEADAWSKEACDGINWAACITGTRGTVLVAMGQHEEGMKLLKYAFDHAETDGNKAENACWMAVSLSRRRQLDEAQNYLTLVRQLDPRCKLIPMAEREIAQTR